VPTHEYDDLAVGAVEALQAGADVIAEQVGEIAAAFSAGTRPAEITRRLQVLATVAEALARNAREVADAISLRELEGGASG
jgi:predicted TIM-barrel enzyme